MTREEILLVADKLFRRQGYRRTTIEDIAKEAGIGKGSVYLHFESKEELGKQWMEAWHEKLLSGVTAQAETGKDISEKVSLFMLERVMARYRSLQQCELSMNEILASLDDLIRQYKKRFQEIEAEKLAEYLEVGVRSGDFYINNVLETARTMMTATNGLLPYAVRPEHLGPACEVEAHAKNVIDLMLKAITNKS